MRHFADAARDERVVCEAERAAREAKQIARWSRRLLLPRKLARWCGVINLAPE